VIGVTTAIITQGQNINLAVPANYLRPMLSQKMAMNLAEFAKTTKDSSESEDKDQAAHNDADTDPKTGKVDTSIPPRDIPDHDPDTFWKSCQPQDIEDTVKAIGSAIEIGAPAYNKMSAQGFEECFRIYEGTALKQEQGSTCKSVRDAFGDGLLKAGGVKSYKDKAWAMRDAFDGLMKVAARWCFGNEKVCKAKAPTVHKLLE
jgi:serine protease Do